MKSLATWKNSVFNKRIDFDNASYDCVDVSKSWIMYLSDKNWTESAGWGNAKDIYSYWKDTYLERIPRGNAPKLGDIVVMNGNVGGGYGHTGVVVGIDGRNITIYQQNTFTQQPVYTGVFDAYANYITGFLRPKIAFSEGAVALEGYQRVAVKEGARYRDAPNLGGKILEVFTPPDPVNFKGFVRGESVEGNNIWFVGRFTGGYSHSSGYTDSSTNGLPDLTPVVIEPPKLADNQRMVGTDAMNVRSSAKIDTVNNNVVKLLQPSAVITLKGYVRGQDVDGVNIWFVLDDGTYTWSGGYTNQTVGNLPDLTPKPPVDPQEPQVPQYPAPTNDPLVTKVYNKKNPVGEGYVPTDLVDVSNGHKLRKEAADSLALMRKQASSLNPGSGYRSFATQKTLYENYVKKDGQEQADRYSARPGYSEHQTGLTMDFTPIDDSFKIGAAYKFLVENGHKYGWILRYPADKETVTGYMSEPWHWRYVGIDLATDMKNKNITTLEEYFSIPGGLYPDQEKPVPEDPKDPTDPEPKPEPPTEKDKNAKVEGMKVIGRNGILAAMSAVIAAGGDWALLQLAGLNMPEAVLLSLGGLVYAGLLYLDKWIHENAKIKLKGIVGF